MEIIILKDYKVYNCWGRCGGEVNWFERSASDQWSNLGRPLFLVINLLLLTHTLLLLATVTKFPEGVVVGFKNSARAHK